MPVFADGISVPGCRFCGFFHLEFLRVGQGLIWGRAIRDAVCSSVFVVWHFRAPLLCWQLLWLSQEGAAGIQLPSFRPVVKLIRSAVPASADWMPFYAPQKIEFPVRTNMIPRQIPDQSWYMQSLFSVAIGGILPFGAVFIELFFILSSVWLNQVRNLLHHLSVPLLLRGNCAGWC